MLREELGPRSDRASSSGSYHVTISSKYEGQNNLNQCKARPQRIEEMKKILIRVLPTPLSFVHNYNETLYLL